MLFCQQRFVFIVGAFTADRTGRKCQKPPKNIKLYFNIFQKLFSDLLFISEAFSIFDFQDKKTGYKMN